MGITKLSVEQTKQMLMEVADAIIENKPYLTEIDSKIGDGDHGIGMSGGLSKAKDQLQQRDTFASVNEVFKTAGMAMISSMGGASGVIFGTMFLAAAKAPAAQELDCALLAQIMAQALEDIQKAGKASVGDKTMVDALSPAVDALKAYEGDDLTVQLKAASEAAAKGVEDTKNYVAKYGRAKSLMERAIGFQDAGATSISIILKAMYDYVCSAA